MWVLRLFGWCFAFALVITIIWFAYDSTVSEMGASDTNRALLIAAICILFFMAYFLPTIIAQARAHVNWPAIAALNLFLGWTALGWIVCLVWSLTRPQPQTIIVHAPPAPDRLKRGLR